ncbi:hypothetical protein [Desulfofustis glycolicus]|uniref:Uncharacterized protein n=1 Tax=Desulfofustis glycolicus DSM 9705 TaxID=1121409 RepID=A0A1M5RVK0_9BACT|nr:hypothetical protein [Desulfofustis glycolicus]SHH30058.1 hypothetical protein SAMN02745124_00008 [Desulfofustis glycolicus DSM 9705]
MPSNQDGAAHGNHSTLTPLNLQEIITEDNAALRALGTLLRTARLAEFDSSTFNQSHKADIDELQHGLYLLISLYLEKQERVLQACAEQYQKSNEYLLRLSATRLKMVVGGAIESAQHARKTLLLAIRDLDTVIEGDNEFKPAAEELKAAILQHDLMQAAPSRQGKKGLTVAS